jgi:sugar lactone lactonase YvrE
VVCKSDGSLYFTDPGLRVPLAEREVPHAGIYRITPDGTQSLVADFAAASGALCAAYQGQSKWHELFSLAKTTEWAMRSEAYRERMIARGGETAWNETVRWLDDIHEKGGEV